MKIRTNCVKCGKLRIVTPGFKVTAADVEAFRTRYVCSDCEEPTVPCGVCGKPTTMKGTKRCDRCWELEGRIKRDPELARKILNTLV